MSVLKRFAPGLNSLRLKIINRVVTVYVYPNSYLHHIKCIVSRNIGESLLVSPVRHYKLAGKEKVNS